VKPPVKVTPHRHPWVLAYLGVLLIVALAIGAWPACLVLISLMIVVSLDVP
jgi:hypothetical protein